MEEWTVLKRYTGDEIHGFMFGDYRSDEARWIDGKHMEHATILGMAHQTERLLAALTEISKDNFLYKSTQIAIKALAEYRSPNSGGADGG
jgi:hypothetical protein